jgi:alkylation response protein AidB-like acyl-CoA dehydrogenase
MIDGVASLVPAMQGRATALDEAGSYPLEDMAALVEAGALLAPFPVEAGGLGLGTAPDGAGALAAVLTALGRGNLAVGRLYEGHVNAVRLLARYGTEAQVRRAAADAAAGLLFGLWVTDGAVDGLRAGPDGRLRGGKAFCSGAGHAGRAIVTIETMDDEGVAQTRLAFVSTDGAVASRLAGRLHGMRAACTGLVSFEGGQVGAGDWLGPPGAYLQEPDFSAGAWRTSAVTCGGLAALVGEAMRQLVARGRSGDPHQRARMGRAWIAQETALLWRDRAAMAAEGVADDAPGIIATVNFARIAIEAACLEAMTLVERSLGLAAFVHPNPVERMRRDLATYLRQPAADEVLTEAAAHVMRSLG